MNRRPRFGGRRTAAVAAALTVLALVAGIMARPGRAWRPGSLDRVSSVPAPDSPSRVVADPSGVVITGVSELRVVDANGDERWSSWFGDAAVLGPVAADPTLVVVAVDRRALAAFSRPDGTPQWERPATDPLDVATGTVAGGAMIVGTVSRTGVLEVLDGAHGTPRWSVPLPVVGPVLAMNVRLIGERAIVAWSDGEASKIRAFDLGSGRAVWADDRVSYASMPTVTDEIVVFAVNDGRPNPRHRRGRVHALDVTTGEERWATDVRGLYLPSVAAAASARVVTLVDLKGTVTAIDLRTHERRWRSRTGRPQAEADPHVVGRIVAMTTYGTGLQALGARDGRPMANDVPGPSQTEVTIVASAASGHRLYLLVQIGRVRGELWMLEAGE